MPDNPVDRIKLTCSCGKKLAVAASAAGRKVKCPTCGEISRVPEAPTAAARAPSAPKASNTSLLEELAQQEKAARPLTPSAPRSTQGRECPNCRGALPVGAVLCVACGYNMKTGQKVKMGGATSGKSIGSLVAAVAGRNSFLFGCLLSGIGALVGAGLWSGIAIATGYEMGWIGWGLGALAGFGMAKGYGQPTRLAGASASALAVGGIVLAKVLILVFIVHSVVTGHTSDSDEPVPGTLEAEATEEKAVSENESKGDAEETKMSLGEGLMAFFIVMFRPLDALFLLLAIGTAYRLASAGSGGGD